jgi:hypothetical protein
MNAALPSVYASRSSGVLLAEPVHLLDEVRRVQVKFGQPAKALPRAGEGLWATTSIGSCSSFNRGARIRSL